MKSLSSIVPLALCVIRRGDEILVITDTHRSNGVEVYRPLGGDIPYGEYSWETIRKQIRLNLGEEIKNLQFLGPAEEVWKHDQEEGHEIIFLFECEFSDPKAYKKEEFLAQAYNGQAVKAKWVAKQEFKKKRKRLYPESLLEMMANPLFS